MARVHSTAVIGPDVQLGERVAVGPHAVLLGRCRIGDDCWLGPGVVIGTPPEVASVPHEAGWAGPGESSAEALPGVVVGAGTVLRELTMVHRGWRHETRLGANCYVMNKVYIAHDCRIEDGVTMASTATLGGHVRVGAGANLGMGATVHQRRVIGPGAMVGMGAVVSRDVPPFGTAFGNPARLRGVNSVGMTRAGVAEDTIDSVRSAYEQRRLPESAELHGLATDAFEWWAAAQPQRPLV
jgi:UDP-N-acetylglucosamine acyltransferase